MYCVPRICGGEPELEEYLEGIYTLIRTCLNIKLEIADNVYKCCHAPAWIFMISKEEIEEDLIAYCTRNNLNYKILSEMPYVV